MTAPATPPAPAPRMSIVTRTVLLTAGIAAIAVLVAGIIAYPLVRSAAESQARAELSSLADLTVTALDRGSAGGTGSEPFPRDLIEALQYKQITGFIVVDGSAPPPGILPSVLADALSGVSVSVEGTTPEGTVLIEARPLAAGGAVILEQPYTVVGVEAGDAVKRVAASLLLGLLIAVPIGYWAARRLTRPLRAARDAANQMADGSRDVTLRPEGPIEIADIAVSLNRLNSALVVSEGRQREFLLSVSHELRTPLTALRGYGEALADGLITGDRVREVGAVLVTETGRVERFTADLLELARLEADDFSVVPADVELGGVATEAAEAWRARAEAEQITVRLDGFTTPVAARADARRVRQVLDGLIENALRATPAGGSVTLAAVRGTGTAGVAVEDTGRGLSDEDLADAFTRGLLRERYRESRPVGTGLGLSIATRLAARMGGRVHAEHARTPPGARFVLELPAVAP